MPAAAPASPQAKAQCRGGLSPPSDVCVGRVQPCQPHLRADRRSQRLGLLHLHHADAMIECCAALMGCRSAMLPACPSPMLCTVRRDAAPSITHRAHFVSLPLCAQAEVCNLIVRIGVLIVSDLRRSTPDRERGTSGSRQLCGRSPGSGGHFCCIGACVRRVLDLSRSRSCHVCRDVCGKGVRRRTS